MDTSRLKIALVWVLSFLALTALLAVSPTPTGDDWDTFYYAAQRLLSGAPLYNRPTYSYFSNPPWLAVLLAPLSLLPFRWGWAALAVISLMLTLLLARRWQTGFVRPSLALLSPPLLYILLHGQVDALVLGGLLLPCEWWILVGVTKPQAALGLAFGVKRERWFRALALTGLVLLVSLGVWGNWPLQLLGQPAPFVYAAHNLWLGLWPFQVPVGVLLIVWGIRHQDERFLMAASPFLAPYAAMSSLLGPWLAVSSLLSDWEAAVVWLSWWGVVIWRNFMG